MPSDRLLFGWCLPFSKEHTNCKKSFQYEGKDVVCGCDCHVTSVDTSVTPSVDDTEDDSAVVVKDSKPKKEK